MEKKNLVQVLLKRTKIEQNIIVKNCFFAISLVSISKAQDEHLDTLKNF